MRAEVGGGYMGVHAWGWRGVRIVAYMRGVAGEGYRCWWKVGIRQYFVENCGKMRKLYGKIWINVGNAPERWLNRGIGA